MKTHRAVEYVAGLDDYDLPAEYPFDPAKMKPNPYAARLKAQAKSPKPRAPQTVIPKRVYLYPHQIKLLARLDKNFSAAVRKLIDTYKE